MVPPVSTQRLLAPEEFFLNYYLRTGEWKTVPISNIDLSKIQLNRFSQAKRYIDAGIPGSYPIDSAGTSYATGFPESAYLGHVTPRLRGTLVIDKHGDYSFDGALSVDRDSYDFDQKKRGARTPQGEFSTAIGRQVPGRNFYSYIGGTKRFSETGKSGAALRAFAPAGM